MTMDDDTGRSLIDAWETASYLQGHAGGELNFQFRRYPEESHRSIPLRSVYDGLQAIFDGWSIPDAVIFSEQAGLAGLEKHFAAISSRLGYSVPIPEGTPIDIFARGSNTRPVVYRRPSSPWIAGVTCYEWRLKGAA